MALLLIHMVTYSSKAFITYKADWSKSIDFLVVVPYASQSKRNEEEWIILSKDMEWSPESRPLIQPIWNWFPSTWSNQLEAQTLNRAQNVQEPK